MAENLSEQLDQALTALAANPELRPRASGEVAALLQVATELRHLPRPDFNQHDQGR